MRLPLVSLLLVSVLLCGIVLAQDSSEESGAPKRVLKKYRVRRPVIVDEQGNVVRAGPRLRRVRVKNPRPNTSLETAAVISPAPQIVSSTPATPQRATPPQPQQLQHQTQILQTQPQRQLVRQRVISQNEIAQQQQQQQQNQHQQQQQQQQYFEEQGVVEQVRSVPTFRQATSSANREALLANVKYKPSRGTGNAAGDESDRKVGTTRNYSRINDDGSFTFGYEAEDGSFKEETRGVDCVVRGKYGYIDPEGVRREFEYVSGNPCDPNDPNKEEQAEEEEEEDALSPSRPLIRQRVRPTELSENNIQQGQQQTVEERLPEDQLANFIRPAPRQRIARPNIGQPAQGQIRQRVRITTPPPTYESPTEQPAYIVRQRQLSARPSIFQEPSQSLDSDRSNSGRGFNFDSEVQRIASIHRPGNQPQPLYEQPFRQVQHIGAPVGRQVFGSPAFHQQQQQEQQQQPEQAAPTPSQSPPNSNFGRYRTELVFDPQSGQYTSVLVNTNAATNQEFQLTQKLRAFSDPTQEPISNSIQQRPTPTQASPPSGSFTSIQQFGQPQIQYYHEPTQPQPQQQQIRAPLHQAPSPTNQSPQDPSQINQFLARHAYRVHQDQTHQSQPQPSVSNLQFIPPHLRPEAHQTAEIQRQEVREINLPHQSRLSQQQGLSANSAAAANSNGQIDAFLRALNIDI